MPTNLLSGFNALFVSGGAEKERRKSNVTKTNGRGGNELIEEWPCRNISISVKRKPPSSINVPVKPVNPTHQENSGPRSRRNSDHSDTTQQRRNSDTTQQRRNSDFTHTSKQQRNKSKSRTIKDDELSRSCSTAPDSTLFNSLRSGASDMSCYSLNDMPSTTSSVRTRRNSVRTEPGLTRTTRRRSRRDVNQDRPTSTRALSIDTRSSRSIASRKKSVRFTDDAPTHHLYSPISPNTHYTADDDDYFRQYTLTLARGVLRLLKTEAVHDESFDVLTGLPSAQCLRRYLNHPDISAEEVVGIEDLLAGPGIAGARKRLKIVQTKKLLEEQRRQLQLGINDPMSLAKSLKKTSSISSNIARCRAAYALGMEGTETRPTQSQSLKTTEKRLSRTERRTSKRERL